MDNSTQISEEAKNIIYTQLADAMLEGLETNVLSGKDSETSAQYVLERLEAVTTQEELLSFLEEVSDRWPTYKNVYLSAKEDAMQARDNLQILETEKQLQSIQQ